MKIILLFISLLLAGMSPSYASDIDSILVVKLDRKMFLLSQGNVVREYYVVFGANPKGHKQEQGDEKTPEGKVGGCWPDGAEDSNTKPATDLYQWI